MTISHSGSAFSTAAAVVLTGLACFTVAGCASTGDSQVTPPAPVQTSQPPEPTPQTSAVVARERLETLPAPLDTPVPIALQSTTPVAKDGYEGWYAVVTTQTALLDAVLADWEAWLLASGFEVERRETRLNAQLKLNSAETPEVDEGMTSEATAGDQPERQAPKQAFAAPQVSPGETAWLQIRVLSPTGSEYAQRPQEAHLALAYLSRV